MRQRSHVGWAAFSVLFIATLCIGLGFWHAGYRAYVIHTGSMESTLMPGDLIIDRPASDGYRPGEIITFRHSAGPDLVTHRITDISQGFIHTKGDANRSADVWDIPPSFVQGSVQWQLPGFGYLAVFLQQPTGIATVLVVIVGLVLLWGLFFPPPTSADEFPEQAGTEPADEPASEAAAAGVDHRPPPTVDPANEMFPDHSIERVQVPVSASV